MINKSFTFPKQMPLIPLKDTVVFPQTIMSLYINDVNSKNNIKKACKNNKLIFLSCLQNPGTNPNKVYKTGCVSMVMRMKVLENNRMKILIQGLKRAAVNKFENQQVHLNYFQHINQDKHVSEREKRTIQEIKDSLRQLSQTKKTFSRELFLVLNSVKSPGHFCDMLISNFEPKLKDLQKALETIDVRERIKMAKKIVQDELELSKLQGRLQNLIKKDLPKPLFPSSEPFKSPSIGNSYRKEELKEFKQRMEEKNLPKNVEKETLKHLSRLDKMHAESSEASMIRNYLEWIFELPWNDFSQDNLDLENAQNILDEEHFALKKSKERILEFLAVRRLNPKSLKSPILCFAGPPGVGKTSLGKSIARSMGRKYYRISLGGIRDEAEIRGHRRTYIGALPGKIIQALKSCGTKNPVIVLDEIDKMCSDFRGDPGSALLEVLDPEQNQFFKDHYLNLDFDLSYVFFIATANLTHQIPAALKDRLEVIPISGYTSSEKKQIAKQYLISKELKNNGLPENHINFTDRALETLIHAYTREAGLRNLRRQISSICRKAAKKFVLGQTEKMVLDENLVSHFLGGPCFFPEDNLQAPRVGVAAGLAWTETGGQILYVEAIDIKSKKGDFTLTGNLKDVMKESARAALSYVKRYIQKKSDAHLVEKLEKWFDTNEIHIHLRWGAIPKDGPSAGVTLASALLSLITNTPLKNTVAMTGEITLHGEVLPVGGIKEKALAAFNHGVKTCILPYKNKKDLDEIPKEVKQQMNFVLVSHLDEVFKEVLVEDSLNKKTSSKNAESSRLISAA